MKSEAEIVDVVIVGGGLVGAAAALTLTKRGLRCVVLESRAEGRPQKVVVGEAVTEGTSLFLRHELGLEPWFKEHAYRKFGFDFFTWPEQGASSMEDCHELMLSQAPLEKIPNAYDQLIPTYHVERPALNDHVAALAEQAGVDLRRGVGVERIDLGEGNAPHVVHYLAEGEAGRVAARWVIDASGRKCVLSRQLGIHHAVPSPNTAAVWNRFENVNADASVWSSYHGIDRRRHTIHFTGQGFWIWWIHQNGGSTSVGVTWDKDQHDPDLKASDHGFGEMIAKFPVARDLLAGAVAKEPYQLYGHLPYRSDYWISPRRFALLGDAAWFTDALYSIGLETATRQLVFLTQTILDDRGGMPRPDEWFAKLNMEFDHCCRAVARLNEFKYKHGWADPQVMAQTVLYETAEIGPLYHLQRREDWTWENQQKHYRIQWGTRDRIDRLDKFLAESLAEAGKHHPRPIKKGLLPGPVVYRATWPLWNLPGQSHWFFRLIRGWGYWERWAQRYPIFPDVLKRMAMSPRALPGDLLRSMARAGREPALTDGEQRSARAV